MTDYISLHKKLCRFDVEKDATKPHDTSIKEENGRNLFSVIANYMFGKRES
jgi:hypothetical protein